MSHSSRTQVKNSLALIASSSVVAPFASAAPVQTMNFVSGKERSLSLRALY